MTPLRFHPIEPAGAHATKRWMTMAMAPVGWASRRVWRNSAAARSTHHEASRLWRAIWRVNRAVGFLPRTTSYRISTTVAPGIRMSLDLSRLNDAFAFCYGAGESDVAFVGSRLCPEDGVVLDVGANIGSTALIFAAHARRGLVYAFEPSRPMQDALDENITLNGVQNIRICRYGLSDRASTAHLAMAMQGNPGSAYVTSVAAVETPEAIELRTLDDAMGHLERIDFVKIDVEGHEAHVLRGGLRVLARCRPAILVEINEPALARQGSSVAALTTLLSALGYTLHHLVTGVFRPYRPEEHAGRGIHNVVAIHPASPASKAAAP